MIDQTVEQLITDTLEKNYMPYAMSVIISRAIPEIDGFKPSHRKLLYTMYKMGLLTGSRTKSSNVVGQTMKLNPHGDGAIYETLVRLTRGNAALLHPLIDSKGNFGKEYSRDMSYAAPRYTEVKLDEFCNEFFKDIDKDNVEFVDNYDGSMKEPLLLPVTFPSILVNANTGIAVGMASSICSFNLREICETTIAYLKNPSCDIQETLIAPDFPGGGSIIYKKSDFKSIFETGRGSFKIRAKYRFDKKINCIEIYEIPYTTTSEAIIEKVVDLIKQGKLKEVVDIRDETDLNGLKITLDLRRGIEPDKLMTRLFKQTSLEDSFGCNFNILVKSSPKVMGIREILYEWSLFRIDCIKRRIRFDIDKKGKQLHLLYGLRKILLDIDKAIAIVRHTEEDSLVVPNLMDGFGIDEIQAEFVAEIKLRNLNKEYILKRINEIDSLEKELSALRLTLDDDKEIKKIIIAELNAVMKKYGKDRTTDMIEDNNVDVYVESEFIEDYNLKLFLTEHNYLKKISLVSLRSAAEQKLKDDDKLVVEFETSNKNDLLCFSNKAVVYKLKIHEIADCKASALGEYLPNLLELSSDENIVYIVPTESYSGYMLFAFENGKVAKVSMKSYETKTNRKKLINAYSSSSALCGCLFIEDDIDIALKSSNERVLVVNTADINAKSTRDTIGVQVMTCRKNTTIKSMGLAENCDLADPSKYKTKNIPAAGFYLKDEDRPKQISLFEE